MIAAGASIDLASLPANLLPDLIAALPQGRAKRAIDLVRAAQFPHLSKEDQMSVALELNAAANPGFIDRLRVKKKDETNG